MRFGVGRSGALRVSESGNSCQVVTGCCIPSVAIYRAGGEPVGLCDCKLMISLGLTYWHDFRGTSRAGAFRESSGEVRQSLPSPASTWFEIANSVLAELTEPRISAKRSWNGGLL